MTKQSRLVLYHGDARTSKPDWLLTFVLGLAAAGLVGIRCSLILEVRPQLLELLHLPSAMWTVILLISTGTAMLFVRALPWYEHLFFLMTTETLLFGVNYLLAVDIGGRSVVPVGVPLVPLTLRANNEVCGAVLLGLTFLQVLEFALGKWIRAHWHDGTFAVSSLRNSHQ